MKMNSSISKSRDAACNFMTRYICDFISVIVQILVVTIFLTVLLNLKEADFNVPLETYGGGDDMSLLMTARLVQDSGWNTGTDNLAYPGEYYYNATEIITGLHNTDVFLVKIFMLLTGNNVGLSANLTYLSLFYITALIAYMVLRLLKINCWLSVCGATVYSFQTFIFVRAMSHIVLSCYCFIPLAILMAIWLYEDEKYMKPCRQFFTYKRNWFGIVMSFFVANEGIGYWQVFACFYMAIAAASVCIKRKNGKYLLNFLVNFVFIVIFILLACVPEIVCMAQGNADNIIYRERSIQDAELYGLKIAQLFLPVNAPEGSWLEKLIADYNTLMPLVNENISSYMGMMGIAGFIILIFWMFNKRYAGSETLQGSRLQLLSEMGICTIIFATIGGIGSMIFLLGIQLVRGTNRISIWLSFICIAAFCMVIQSVYGKFKNRIIRAAEAIVIISFSVICVFNQFPNNNLLCIPQSFDYKRNSEKWYSDKYFFEEVEKSLSPKAAVFQVPFVEYPENAGMGDMKCLEQASGYIHSRNLRWSFGSAYGTDTADWYEKTSLMPADKMVSELKAKNFSGICIYRDAYIEREEELEELEMTLASYADGEKIVSQDQRLVFFKLNI